MSALSRRRIKIPDEIALIGFTNSNVSELMQTPLSVIKQPANEMGRQAAELLLQIVESKRTIKDFEKRVLTPEIIIRESSVKI